MKDGKIDIKWRIVKAPITGNFTYRIKEGSSQWWAAIQVRNHKYPVMKMEYYKEEFKDDSCWPAIIVGVTPFVFMIAMCYMKMLQNRGVF